MSPLPYEGDTLDPFSFAKYVLPDPLFQFQDENGDEYQWCATARGSPDDPQRILFEANPEVSRADPKDKKKRVMVKLPLRERIHKVLVKFGSLELMKKAVHG